MTEGGRSPTGVMDPAPARSIETVPAGDRDQVAKCLELFPCAGGLVLGSDGCAGSKRERNDEDRQKATWH